MAKKEVNNGDSALQVRNNLNSNFTELYNFENKNSSVYTIFNLNSADYILNGGNTKDSNLSIGTKDNYNLTLKTNNMDKVTITSDGNVGIEVPSPNEKLTVFGNICATGIVYGTIVTPPVSAIVVDVDTSDPVLRITQRGSGPAIVVEDETNPDSSAFIVSSGGNVGIGALIPSRLDFPAKLQIATDLTPVLVVDHYGNQTDGAGLTLRKATGSIGSPVSPGINDQLGFVSAQGYGTTSFGTSADASIEMFAAENFTETTKGTYITISTTTIGMSSKEERFRILDNGFVGIGTSTPNSILTVVGDISATGAVRGSAIVDAEVRSLSSNWQDTFTTTQSNSARWNIDTWVRPLSSNWQDTFTTTQSNSAQWDASSIPSVVKYLSANNISVSGMNIQAAITEAKVTPVITSNTLTLDLSAASLFYVTLDSPVITMVLQNVPSSPKVYSFTLQLMADGTPRAVNWPTSFRWSGGTAPLITTTLNKVDTFTFLTHDGGSNWFAFISNQDQ